MTPLGIGYEGSSSIKSSGGGNLEIIPSISPNRSYSFYKFEFNSENSTPLKVIINGKQIYLYNGSFNMDRYDPPIHSFIIVDGGINFSWIGAYSYK